MQKRTRAEGQERDRRTLGQTDGRRATQAYTDHTVNAHRATDNEKGGRLDRPKYGGRVMHSYTDYKAQRSAAEIAKATT